MVADQDLALYSDTNRTFQIDDRTLISQLYCFLLEGKKTAYSGFFRGSGPNTCAVFFEGRIRMRVRFFSRAGSGSPVLDHVRAA